MKAKTFTSSSVDKSDQGNYTANFAKGGTASAGEKELAFDTAHERKTDHVSRGTNTRSENTVTGVTREELLRST